MTKPLIGRFVLFGDVYDSKNNPLLVALELNPTDRGGKSLNVIEVASAYGKEKNLQNFINKSKILYVEPNKKRTHMWLKVNRLKLPLLSSSTYGFFNNSISQNSKNVNTKNDESSNDIKYSIGYTTDNNPVVVINDDILKGVKKSDWVKTVKKTISDKFSNGIPIKGRFIKVNRITRNEYTNSKYSKNKKNYDTVIYKDKFKTANNLDEIIIASTNYVNEDLKHERKDSFKEFARGDVLIRVGSNDYSAKVIVGFTKGNEMVLYDIINFVPEKLDIKKIDTQYRPTTENVESDRTSASITNSISENRNNVNTKNDESSNDIKYSMGGLKAETADKSALEKAMELEKDGTDSEKIRKETGWFKGYDGKWRFEIDNSELEFKTDIEKNRAAAIELAKMKVKSAELEEKIVNNTATKAEENEYYNLDEKMIEYRKGVKLSDVINHPKLFEAYPQLKNVDVYYEISSVNRGVYSSNGNVIMLNPMHTIDEQKEAIIHEIQHAIQGIENFANGSNLEYWKNLGYSDEEAMAMYYNTAGEREARDVSARRDYNAEQRKNIRPDIDRKDVVFANSGDAVYSADKDFTKYDNLETLDDKEIKVYNKRGWAYGLFNREDMKLLNEKFSELDRRLNSRTDNMLADGTRIVEVNNKIVSIGGTYNDPEIYSVLLINAENETYAEYVKEEILGYVNEQRNYSRRKYEEIWETTPFVYGEENIRHYNAYDYIYKKGGDDTGLRATLPGDFSRYGYNKESNIRGTSDANAKGEVSAVQLDEDTSDIKYATDDTINDWLDDESTPQGIDYEKAVEKNPVIAVAKIYKSAAQTAKSGLAQGKNVKLDEKEYLRIAGSIMQTYGIKGKYNPNYKKELASQLKNFVDSIGKKDANFTDLFEEFVNDCKGGILLSGEYDTTLMREEREFVLDLIHDKTLFIRPRDIQQIEEDYGSVANYRVALELNPTDRGGKSLNVIKVASAYGKEKNLHNFINKSKILYVEPNKERTHNWLTVNRLKLPLPSTRYGFFNNSISQSENNVNTKNNTGKGVESGDVKYSIKENVKNKVSGEIYDKVVVLDTNIFKGIPPRNWGKTFRNFISKHLTGKKFLTFDENGKEEIIEFAKPNERVTKNGANNSHKVIDKLSRKSDRNSKLVIVHSDEVINISEKQNENAEHSHQWLDENGWEYRNAIVMDKYGKLYSVTLNIAKSKDGRNILYDINKINEVGYGVVLSNAKGKRSSHINPNFVNNSISQSENNVNTKNDESGNDIKYSMGGLKAETADKSALEKAMELEKDGTDSEKIRKETGWFKGYDGKWRFEIDNSELEFKTDIEKNRAAAIELAKMKVKSAELEEKIVNNTATKAEENEYYNLDEKMIEYRKGVKLSDVINHPKLFEAYPQLKNVDVYYEISSVNRGVYSSNGNVIMLNPMHTIDEQKEAIIHEIQHAIQGIENFANGSNLEYWKNLGYSDEEAMAMYYNTAGEREARDVSARRDYNAEQRKNIRPDIDRKDVVFANSGDPVYSADENIMQNDFEEKVDQIENNTYNSNDVVIMGRTPKVLQDIGFNSLPVAMTKNHIYSVAVSEARAKNEGRYKKNTNYHDLGFNTVKQIYNKISDPLMVIAHPDFTNKESRDSTHKVIALVDLSVNNKQVIAPILVDYESIYSKKRMDVNLVATYFNKNNINDLIKEAIALENNNQVGFYYLDKKRTQSIIKRTGYQLPRRLNNLSSNIIIRKIDSNVNKKINKITQSQQFVRWFGDWQNKPKTASKVVDGNGEPLVVYHQTGNDFTVFDTKHTGAGEFDSEMPTGIFMKPTNRVPHKILCK